MRGMDGVIRWLEGHKFVTYNAKSLGLEVPELYFQDMRIENQFEFLALIKLGLVIDSVQSSNPQM